MKKWLQSNNLNSKTRYLGCPIPLVAVTGGIGTGKSTFCNLLEENDYSVIRADQIVKQVYQLTPVQSEVLAKIPEVFVDENLDFKKLRTLFFNDEQIKNFIETLIYKHIPSIFHEITKKPSFIQSKIIFYEIPLLFEKGFEDQFDFIICISLTEQEQLKRVKQRDYENKKTSSTDEIKSILAAQLSLKKKEQGSHLVLFNESLDSLIKGLNQFEKNFLPLIKNN